MLAEDVSEEDFLNIARHPTGGVISDGFSLVPEGTLAEGKHHPRSYGAFPYFLRRFVREQGALRWEEAIHKLTGHPAARFRLGASAASCAKATGLTSWSSTLKPSASAPTLPTPTAIRRASTA